MPSSQSAYRVGAAAARRWSVRDPEAGCLSTVGNVIWCVVAGIWLAIGHLLTSIPLFLSIIGIPLGIANIKLIPVSLLPLGARIVDADDPLAFYRR
ncbi:Inner membrane component domain-containing protein [Streptosporangium canum]|uniref:Inner membrane component domain-containing protein n=1 Tax=Streptosporangium canum TaxID=324952 RepID=A0A1I4F3L8_9ACTN|nr:YccF domain-containing protein [Streptosporangium canum]SFL10991.1 Inner membrane component domain-containing protein [Streptosporangium canum]